MVIKPLNNGYRDALSSHKRRLYRNSEHNIWLKSHLLFSVIQARCQRDTEQISRDGPLEIGFPVLVREVTPLQAVPPSTTGKRGNLP